MYPKLRRQDDRHHD